MNQVPRMEEKGLILLGDVKGITKVGRFEFDFER